MNDNNKPILSASGMIEVTAYELAYSHVTSGGHIGPKAIQEITGCNKRAAAEIILQLQQNKVISEPDDDGIRTLI